MNNEEEFLAKYETCLNVLDLVSVNLMPAQPSLHHGHVWGLNLHGICRDYQANKKAGKYQRDISSLDFGSFKSDIEIDGKQVLIGSKPNSGLAMMYSGYLLNLCIIEDHNSFNATTDNFIEAILRNITFFPFLSDSGKMIGGTYLILCNEANGEKVLLVRAFNVTSPEYGKSVVLSKLLEDFVDYAIEVADRNGIPKIAIASGSAGSNNSFVEEIIDQKFTEAIELEESPETTLNDFDIWNASGEVPSMLVR